METIGMTYFSKNHQTITSTGIGIMTNCRIIITESEMLHMYVMNGTITLIKNKMNLILHCTLYLRLLTYY